MFKHNTNKHNIENSLEKHMFYCYQIFSLNINILIKHKLYKTERSFIVKDKSIIFLSWNDYFIKKLQVKVYSNFFTVIQYSNIYYYVR